MNFDQIVVKESPGLCRCCLSEGCYKDLGTEYTWMNETEVYAEMLLDCFDVGITQHNDGPNGPKRLICEVCITRLRDACNFKKQVVDSEKRFIDMLGRGEFRPKVVMYQPSEPDQLNQLKVENEELEDATDDQDVEYLEDVDFSRDDEQMKSEDVQSTSQPTTSEETETRKRGRPRKYETTQPKKPKLTKGEPRGGQKDVAPKPKTKLKPKPAVCDATADTSIDKDLTPPVNIFLKKGPKRLSSKEKRNIMLRNVTQVLEKTTVMPFRWLKSSYRCFYCYDIFQEASELKAHQSTHTDDDIVKKAMKNYWEPVVYVDVSNMICKQCPAVITDLYEMIDHLIEWHDVVFNKDVGVCMVAFKLDNFNISCLVCGVAFYTFGPLLCHTNKEHKGTSAILCEVCGQHFKHKNLLRLHVKSVHESVGYICSDCGEKFDTQAKLKTHQKSQHFVEKKYKCLVCSLTFQSHYKRSSHMAAEHKNRNVIKCLQCPKTFVFRSMMMTHLRDTHLKVRDHVCSVCGWRAFNSNRLKNHMFKHSGEKNFKCDVCDKAFSTRKIMRAHFARMHKTQQPMIPYGNVHGSL